MARRTHSLTTALVLAAGALGCVGVPPPSALEARLDFPGVRVLQPQWRRLVIDPERRDYRPIERSGAVFDPSRGLVFVGTSQGRFWALDTGTGAVVWAHVEPDGFHSAPLMIDEAGLVVAGNDGGELLGFAPETGAIRWRVDLGGPVRGGAWYLDGVIYARTATQRVFAIEALSGRELWSFERPLPEGYVSGSESGVLVSGDRVYTGFVDGTLAALSAVTGEKLWDVNLATEGHDELVLDDICATPVEIDGTLVVSSYDNGLFGIDAAEGGQRWQRAELTHACGLAVLEQDAIVALAGEGVARVDSLDGTPVWIRRYPAGTQRDPIVQRGLIVVPDDIHGLLLFEALTGQLLQGAWAGAGVAGRPAVLDGRVAVLDNSGEFLSYALVGN
jgi:outer membrane protein assembly factor BamB